VGDGAVGSQPLDAWGWAERVSVIGLFTIACLYALFAMQEIIVPIVTAWVMGAILRPVVDWLETIGLPRIVAVIATAIVALLILLAIIGLLSTPFAYWIGRTSELAALIKEKLQLLSQPLAIFDELSKALSDISERGDDVRHGILGADATRRVVRTALAPRKRGRVGAHCRIAFAFQWGF